MTAMPRYFTFDFPAELKRLPRQLTYSVVSKHGLGIIETTNDVVAKNLTQNRFFEIDHDRFLALRGREIVEEKKIPSFTKQTKWPCGLFHFRNEPNICHTNPGLEFINGQLHIFTRRIEYAVNSQKGILKYQTRLEILKLNLGTMSLSDSIIPELPNRYPSESWEDPRVLIVEGRCFISMATHLCKMRFPVRQCLVLLSDDMSKFEVYAEPKFGGNHPIPQEATGVEKNWTWFSVGGKLFCIYTLEPLCVFRLNDQREPMPVQSIVSKEIKWKYGIIRGSTNPELVEGEYWMFFHSSLPWVDEFGTPVIPNYRRYYVGAITMSMDEPYRITSMTKEPLLIGSEEDSELFLGPPAIFQCGAKLINGDWLLTMGLNEEKSAWISIPHADLKPLMVKC